MPSTSSPDPPFPASPLMKHGEASEQSPPHLSLGSFLYDTLQSLLDSDPDLCELGLLLPSSSPSSLIHSPPSPSLLIPSLPPYLSSSLPPHSIGPPFVLRLDDHALGVAFWAVPPLFRFATSTFQHNRTLLPQPSSSPPSPPLPIPAPVALALLHSTRALLLINADHLTAWNTRKLLLLSPSPPPSPLTLRVELAFLSLLFSKHPKSSEAWAHRRWCLTHLAPTPLPLPLIREELRVCALTAEHYPKNYHAWSHRLFALQCLAEGEGEDAGVADELQALTQWNEQHVSDHAGFHYRGLVVRRVMALHPPAVPHLQGEVEWVAGLQERYPAHETLWYYRRFLCHHLVRETPVDQLDAMVAAEREWVAGREAGVERVGVWGSEADLKAERLSCRVHVLYVAELCIRRRYNDAGGKGNSMAALAAMSPAERAQWVDDLQRVQQLKPGSCWSDRLACVQAVRSID